MGVLKPHIYQSINIVMIGIKVVIVLLQLQHLLPE